MTNLDSTGSIAFECVRSNTFHLTALSQAVLFKKTDSWCVQDLAVVVNVGVATSNVVLYERCMLWELNFAGTQAAVPYD